jgi:hypothetical protein
MNEGFIKLYRKIIDWEWYTDVNTKSLFIHLLLMANHADQRWRGQVIKRGSLVTSYGSLAVQTGLSVKQVRNSLKKLEKTGDVASKSTNRNTLIMVLNYDSYQSMGQTKGIQTADNGHTIGQTEGNQRATNKNVKNDKNIKNKERVERKLPPTLDQIITYKIEINSSVDAERFYDYYNATNWTTGNTPIVDWKAVFRNWSRNEKSRANDYPDWYSDTGQEQASDELIKQIEKMKEGLNDAQSHGP